MNRVLMGLSVFAVLSTQAFACSYNEKGDKKEFYNMHNDGYKSYMMNKDYRNHEMCSLKKSKYNGSNSARHIMNKIQRLDLTPDQRTKIADIKKKYHGMMPQISDAFTSNSLDEKKLNEALNFDIKEMQFKIITESYKILNDIQKGYLKKMIDMQGNYKMHNKLMNQKHCKMRNEG